ncbi:MAG: HlyD family efflux transporter periplasmic adaptor subunit [Pseudomonadota bacterium]
MNQIATDPKRQSLGDALNALFTHEGQATPFAKRLISFSQALIPRARGWVLTRLPDDTWRVLPEGKLPDDAEVLADRALKDEAREVVAEGRALAAPVCLDTGEVAVLVIELQQGGQTGLALAFERLSMVSHLTYARHRPETVEHLQNLLKLLAQLKPGAAAEAMMQELADTLAQFMLADYAAVARFDGTSIADLHISGQVQAKRNAMLPAQLRDTLVETARLRLCTSERAYANGASGEGGLVFHLENPSRNKDILPLIAAAAEKMMPGGHRRRVQWRRVVRRMAVLSLLVGLAFVPIPDGVDLPATVAATSQRVITSPLDAPVLEMRVREGDSVVAGETVLTRFDTREIDLELIAAQAAYTRALLDRERARASRLAADLRTAEIEADRLAAEIDLLQARKDTAAVVAPITGIVLGEGLADLTGTILRRGDPLLQIADPSRLELDLSVQQSHIARLDVGAEGIFRPDFDPSLRFDTSLVFISPAAPSAERSPLYPGRADLMEQTKRLKPGMTGVVAMDRTWRPIWQVVWRGVRDWVLLRVWI